MGHYKVKKVMDLNKAVVGEQYDESDFATVTQEGKFVQFEYFEDQEKPMESYPVKPGVWVISKTMTGLILEPTRFAYDKILEELVNVQDLLTKMDCFFRNLDKYKKFGIEVPKRAALIYGPPGGGKSTNIIEVVKKYEADKATAVIVWATDKIDPRDAKDFIKTFKYEGVEKLIMIAEDIGGVEAEGQRINSQPSLLALLDNKEKTFNIPVFIIATTNHPEMFLSNIANRPGRFDDKIHVGFPSAAARSALVTFYSKNHTTSEEDIKELKEKITNKKYGEFSIAHIQEVVVRAAIYEMTYVASLDLVYNEIQTYKKMFADKGAQLGITWDND